MPPGACHVQWQAQLFEVVGDRADFNSAWRDWPGMSKAQVAYAVSVWRSGIFAKYMHR